MATVFDDGFVEAYSKKTGQKQVIPEHWLDDPVLGKDFELTPSAKAQAAAEKRRIRLSICRAHYCTPPVDCCFGLTAAPAS